MAIYEGLLSYFDAHAVEGTWVHWDKQVKDKSERTAASSTAKKIAKKYKVRYGDTLSELAHKHSISVVELRRYNKLKSDSIRVGQVIKIPAS